MKSKLKHIQLFEAWIEKEDETDDFGYQWTGPKSKHFSVDPENKLVLKFSMDGRKYEICDTEYLVESGEFDERRIIEDAKKYSTGGRWDFPEGGWRLPNIQELEYIDQLLQEEEVYGSYGNNDWEYDYLINVDHNQYYWSNEKAYEDPKNPSRYVWDFRKHQPKVFNQLGRTACILLIREEQNN